MQKKDIKSYLMFSSSKILDILKLNSRIYVLPVVIFYPTNVCNYDCVMCSYSRSKLTKNEVMDFSLMKKTINECSKLLFRPKVHFSGFGEPLTYPYIMGAMKLCKEKKLKWSMTTNGYLLEKYIDDFISNNCSTINISIHGVALEHDKIVGTKGAFERVIMGIKKLDEAKRRLKKNTPLVAVNCVFNNDNIPNLKNLLNTFLKLPINSITFQHQYFVKGDLEKQKDFLIREDNLNKLIEFVDFIQRNKFLIKVNIFPRVKKKDIKGYYTNKNHQWVI